jgi:plasmid stabilization system protein ParE
MRSGYKIEWTVKSIKDLKSINNYLTKKWTEREIIKFYMLLEKRLELISRNPDAFPSSNVRMNVKRCLLSKQTSIYFEVKRENILILSLFDNRKNPKALKI